MAKFDVQDIASFLMGTWRFNLEVRSFNGRFDRQQPHNCFLLVEEAHGAIAEPGARVLNWRILNENMLEDSQSRLRMTTQVMPMHDGRTLFEWIEHGHICTGTFDPFISALTLIFNSPGKSVVYTYQIIDHQTMSLCIVSTTAHEPPTMKFGNVLRVHNRS